MIIKKCDMISPCITLHFKGDINHSSFFSGILTIICYGIIFSFGIYYIIIYINKANPTIYFYTRYEKDAGAFPFNSSSLFHFIRFYSTNNYEDVEINFDSINIFGLEKSIDNYMSDNNLKNYNHWLYGPCNKNDSKNIGHLETIINQNFPFHAACIRKYYDKDKNNYFETYDENFKWPALLHGCANEKAVNYGIIVEKCNIDNGLNKFCNPLKEIDSYLDHLFFSLYFMDQYTDVLNYKTPYIKYLYKLTNAFFPEHFTINHLNFNPSIVTSHTGIIFDNKRYDISYQYTQNEKVTMEKNGTSIIASCYFWMQNTMQYYERNYDRFQDLLSNIGGIGSFITLMAEILNSFVNFYIVLLDTENFIFDIDKKNFDKYNDLKPTILRLGKQIMNPPKSKVNNRKINKDKINQSSIFQILLKDKMDMYKICNNLDAKSETMKNIFSKNLLSKLKYNLDNKKSNKKSINLINNKHNKKNYEKDIIDTKNMSNKDTLNQLKTEIKSENHFPSIKSKFSLVKYIFYICTFKTKSFNFGFYENLRNQIISEENIIQNHLNVYKLLKANNIENINIF